MVKLVGSIVLVSMTTAVRLQESYKLRMRVETLESFLKVILHYGNRNEISCIAFKTDYRQILWRYGFIMAMSFIAQKQEKVLMRHGKVV